MTQEQQTRRSILASAVRAGLTVGGRHARLTSTDARLDGEVIRACRAFVRAFRA